MQHHFKLVDMNKDEGVVMIVEGIPNTMVLMVVNPQILIKRKPHYTTRSGVILRQSKKMGSVYKINLPRTMRVIAIDVV